LAGASGYGPKTPAVLVDLIVAGLISTTLGSFHGLPGGPKNSLSCWLGRKRLPEMLNDAPDRPDDLLSVTTGGTTVNDFRIVSWATQLPVVLLTLHTWIW